jgi:hypothetical protein
VSRLAGAEAAHNGTAALSDIFLSYASSDRARVAPLVQALEAQGLQLWWDRDIDYGQSFHKMIEQALTAAPCVIVVWTRESVQSEWVLNEASEARRRDCLVPVLLDPVAPPLEFRHLQAADLSNWKGDSADPEFTRLRKCLVVLLGKSDAPRPAALAARPARHWWQTWQGQAIGAGGFVIGLSVLVLTLRLMGVIGSPAQPLDRTAATPIQSSPVSTAVGKTDAPTPAPAAATADPLNLLDTDAGAQLLYTNSVLFEEHWKTLFTGNRTAAMVGSNDFAVLALRGDKAVTFDTLAIFVDGIYASVGVKELAIYASSTSSEGPFVKAAQITVPNHPIMQKPFQEFHFAPVQARFVKLQVLSFHGNGSPYVGSIQLYASNTGSRF